MRARDISHGHATPLSQLIREVADLDAEVDGRLRKMGFEA
jgi:hypothetical protein